MTVQSTSKIQPSLYGSGSIHKHGPQLTRGSDFVWFCLWTIGCQDDSEMPPLKALALHHIPTQIIAGCFCTISPTWATASGSEREREGLGRRLNYWHGKLALKRAHASLRNYPLCIETAPPPSSQTHTHNGLTNTTKNGRWAVTEHGQRAPGC